MKNADQIQKLQAEQGKALRSIGSYERMEASENEPGYINARATVRELSRKIARLKAEGAK